MRVKVRYFAAVREQLGEGQDLELPEGSTVGQVRQRLSQISAAHAQALEYTRNVKAALNQVMCDEHAEVGDGAEVAFFPPVTGG